MGAGASDTEYEHYGYVYCGVRRKCGVIGSLCRVSDVDLSARGEKSLGYWIHLLGVFFFVVGQVLTYGFSSQICEGTKHYIDGLFFGILCNIFTLMMVYKTWDMTTDDDLEFSVSVSKEGDIVYSDAYR